MPYRLPADHYRFKPAVVRGTAATRPSISDVGGRPVIFVATDTGDISISSTDGTWVQLNRRAANAPSGIETTIDRTDITSTPALATGLATYTYFTSTVAGTFTKLRSVTGGTAAAATPSLNKMALYSVAANGDMTRKAITAHAATTWDTINTRYDIATVASYTVAVGERLAFAILCVTAGAAPTLLGRTLSGTAVGAEAAVQPRISAQLAGQSDLGATVLDSAVASSVNLFYGALIA